MSNARRLRDLAQKCERLAKTSPNENMRRRHGELAASYRRLAEREDWIEQRDLPLQGVPKRKP